MANARYGCRCGNTVFDLSGRDPGSALICPFCQRQYTYVHDDQVEAVDAERASSEARTDDHQPKLEQFEEPPSNVEQKSNASERRRFSPQFVSGWPPPEREARKSAAQKHKLTRGTVHRTQRDEVPAKRSVMRALLPDLNRPIPGGTAIMIGSIVLSVLLSLTVLAVLLPAHPDGTRTAPWGVVPKEAFWPEIAALILGHLVGFICWSSYLYLRQKMRPK